MKTKEKCPRCGKRLQGYENRIEKIVIQYCMWCNYHAERKTK